jgi:GntR family transcriptional regulator
VKYLIAGGRLKPGDCIPPIRVLAEQLRINPNTVARAYLELEREGIVVMRQGLGTTVSELKSVLPGKEKIKLLARAADALLTDAIHLNLPLDDVIALLRERHEIMQSESSQ